MARLKIITIIAVVLIFSIRSAFAEERELCVNGHPAPRPSYVTYGGKRPAVGYQRDHVCPLCLGCPDTAANVVYQPWPEAHRKDADERRACEVYCAGEQTPERLDAARRWLADRWPRHWWDRILSLVWLDGIAR